jgi:membrane protein implicated in regulation of membrane protease activity
MTNSIFFFSTHLYVFWLLIMIICIGIELLTLSLTTIWFSLAALVLLFVSFSALSFRYQVLLFLILSALFLSLTRPALVHLVRTGKKEKTNAEAMAGAIVPVTKAITRLNKGEIRYNGVYWAATGKDGIAIEAGTTCIILAIQGNTVTVAPEKGDTL